MACREVFAQLGSAPVAGLTAEEAARRLAERGANELIETRGRGAWRILWEQFSSAVVLLLTLGQLGNALAIRSARESVFQIGILSNQWMVGSLLFTFALQLAVIYWPPLQQIFKTAALTPLELLLCIVFSSIVFWSVEGQKLWQRWQDRACR